jgi:acyl-CoA hydrolase
LPSSRIVEQVRHVTLPRSLADLVMTEQGTADLRGATLNERRELLSGMVTQ